MKIYYSGTPTRRGRDVSKHLDLKYIKPHLKKIDINSSIFKKVFHSIKSIYSEFQALKKLNPTHIIYEHAGDFVPTVTILVLKFLKNIELIVDCHTCVYVDVKSSLLKKTINKLVIDFSKILIAHNDETLSISKLHNNMVSLESKVPSIISSKHNIEMDKNKINVVFITRFNSDEPILEMINSTKYFGEEFQFYMTGNYNKMFNNSEIIKYKNIKFTGFVADQIYNEIIYNSDIHVVLTIRDFTLLYGGRESISLEKPLVISDNKTCKKYFDKGSIFVNNTGKNIAKGIKMAYENKTILKEQMKSLKIEKNKIWDSKIKDLKLKINLL